MQLYDILAILVKKLIEFDAHQDQPGQPVDYEARKAMILRRPPYTPSSFATRRFKGEDSGSAKNLFHLFKDHHGGDLEHTKKDLDEHDSHWSIFKKHHKDKEDMHDEDKNNSPWSIFKKHDKDSEEELKSSESHRNKDADKESNHSPWNIFKRHESKESFDGQTSEQNLNETPARRISFSDKSPKSHSFGASGSHSYKGGKEIGSNESLPTIGRRVSDQSIAGKSSDDSTVTSRYYQQTSSRKTKKKNKFTAKLIHKVNLLRCRKSKCCKVWSKESRHSRQSRKGNTTVRAVLIIQNPSDLFY